MQNHITRLNGTGQIMQALVMKFQMSIDDPIKALPYKTFEKQHGNMLLGTTGHNTTKPTGFLIYFASYKVQKNKSS